ncbi:SH3 domain-containing protein [Streptococcus suis]|uniref:SH3 domain-containing protein n=1 Tax=Streptococcus suis TaxID=1307 RepID=UPI001EE734DE|nr:SH3 domain-containing protein [Streptococcus suis]
MTQQALSTNQPRFSIRTYSLGAASVLLAYACLATGPVASANTGTETSTSAGLATVQTTTSSSTGQEAERQVSQTVTQTETNQAKTNQTSTNPTTSPISPEQTGQISPEKIETGTPSSSSQQAQGGIPSTSQTSPASSQQAPSVSQESHNQTRQTNNNQQASTRTASTSSAISQRSTTQTQANTNRNRISSQTRTASTRSSSTSALGDDYPYTAVDAIDPWRLYTRQCTSFVAFRLSKVNGFEIPPAYGNADAWGYRAQREGYRVDMNPAVGAVAWWTSPMHVAWVSSIQGDMVEIEEYNYSPRFTYSRRLIHKNSVSGYIHFKDLAGSPVSQTSPAATQATGLANSGTYTFTQQAPIKAQAKQSSSTLDYYYAGESVRYDRVLTADGYQWISYLSYSGQRRYIPIKQVQASPTPQQPIGTTPTKPQGTIQITNINQAEGSFEVLITGARSPKEITAVSVPVWSDRGGQDDLIWYPAQRQSDGSYKVKVLASKHKNDSGKYHIHVYFTDAANQIDFIGSTTTQLSTTSIPTSYLPSSGTYIFKSRLAIRNSPSLASPILFHYDIGQSVRYDRIITAEGRQWISYVSYSGARRYIAIP